jgi:hypothetical protein
MIDSNTGEVTEILKAGQLDSERPYTKVWITELRRAKNNGEQLVCTMAFEKKTKKGTIETDYFITKVFTKTGLYKRVTKLEDTAAQNCKTGIIEEKVSAVGA